MTRKLNYVDTPMGKIAYEDSGGEKPVALFVHGVFLNGYLWRHVVDRVRGLRRCLCIDLLAHGGTRAAPDQDLSFTAQAEMLEAFCSSLGLDQIDLVANDSGAGISQIFAARHPERIRSFTITNSDTHDNWPPPAFKQTVALAQAGQLADVGRKMLADKNFARQVLTSAYEHPEKVSDETLHTYLYPIYSTEEGARAVERFVAAQDCRHTVEVEPLLKKLAAPTQVVWGTGDIFFALKWAFWLKSTIPGCSRVIEVEGAKLFFPEERPDVLADALREHWKSTQGAARLAG